MKTSTIDAGVIAAVREGIAVHRTRPFDVHAGQDDVPYPVKRLKACKPGHRSVVAIEPIGEGNAMRWAVYRLALCGSIKGELLGVLRPRRKRPGDGREAVTRGAVQAAA